jgi:S1-C subfamily serine protease
MPETVFHPLAKIGDPVQRGVMPLIVVQSGSVIPLGTGFTVTTDGLLVTAVHVIHELEKIARSRLANRRSAELETEFYALYMIDRHGDGRLSGGLLPIRKIWLSDDLDICYCLLSSVLLNDEPVRFPVFRLSPGLPKVGESVIGFGYPKMAGTIEGTLGSGQTLINYRQDTAFTRGQIVEVYPERRDSSMLRFPCFRTNARFDPGMSGGPVMNERGSVCGVICNSLPATDEYPEHISHASLLYPALGTLIDFAPQPGGAAERISVYDVIKKGCILTDDTVSDISVQQSPDGPFSVSIKLRGHEL